MGLFNFLKKKSPDNDPPVEPPQPPPVNNNSYLLQALGRRLSEAGYQVERHPQYLSLIVNSELEIAPAIIDSPHIHPNLLHLLILTMHPQFFPDGIEESIVGFGTTIEKKAGSAIDNYLNTTFLPIINGLSDSHNAELDFSTAIGGQEILWHPKLGNLAVQGEWESQLQNETLFELLKEKLKSKLTADKINWLKVYISKRADGTIIGECNFNNDPWEEGLSAISEYAESWQMRGDFQGLKQFIVFRRCDACSA